MELFRKEDFTFVGNRPHLRLDEEMALIHKELADTAFKKYKKEILDRLLLENGFFRWKSSAYVRRNDIWLLEFIDLQKERYGSKTFCVNFAVMPLYCGRSYITTHLGGRLGTYISGKDVWWDYCNETIAKQSFQNAADAIAKFVFPYFLELSSEEGYRKKLMEDKTKITAEWLEALEAADKERLAQSGIIQLGLPRRLLKG